MKKNKPDFIVHDIKPVYDSFSKVLILGTMPSPKSREAGFYYSHPQNRFWMIISRLFDEVTPVTNQEKEAFLLNHKIALWDVLHSCNIDGADDGSIKNPIVNDLDIILKHSDIKAVFTTGTKATWLYKKHSLAQASLSPIYLPSTSPANCKFTDDYILEKYSVILKYLRV